MSMVERLERYNLFHIFVTIIIVLQVCRRRVVGTTVNTTLSIALAQLLGGRRSVDGGFEFLGRLRRVLQSLVVFVTH